MECKNHLKQKYEKCSNETHCSFRTKKMNLMTWNIHNLYQTNYSWNKRLLQRFFSFVNVEQNFEFLKKTKNTIKSNKSCGT